MPDNNRGNELGQEKAINGIKGTKVVSAKDTPNTFGKDATNTLGKEEIPRNIYS